MEQFLETAQQRFDCYAQDTDVPMTVQFFDRAMQRVEHELFSDWSQNCSEEQSTCYATCSFVRFDEYGRTM